MITDITLLKKQQQALDNARQKAESATAAKSQFLATISHEVRTPISGILGLLELMQEHQLSEELLNLHGGLNQSARNLLHIVNDVLDYSKIEAGKLELNPTEIELGKVLARIVQPQSIHAQQKGLAFHYWQDPNLAQWLFADDIRLHQILNNFLNNAIKFTEHGTISLHVDVMKIALLFCCTSNKRASLIISKYSCLIFFSGFTRKRYFDSDKRDFITEATAVSSSL